MADSNDEVPDDWVPLNNFHNEGFESKGVFLNSTVSGLQIIQTRSEKPNDLVTLYNHEVASLIHRLVEVLDER